MAAPLLSVVICTYNRASLLRTCLDSLSRQDVRWSDVEVIVVDNNSTDSTADAVREFQGKIENLRYAKESNQGLAYSRNKGSDVAAGEYVAYLDDDAMAPPAYLSSVLNMIDKHHPDIIGGPIYPYYTDTKPRWFKDAHETRKYAAESGFSATCRVSGSNFIIRNELLRKLGGFDVALGMKGKHLGIGEEAKVLDLYRLRTPEHDQRVYYSLECHVRHHTPAHRMKLGYVLRRSFLSGRLFEQMRALRVQVGLRGAITLTCDDFRDLFGFLWRNLRENRVRGVDYVLASSMFVNRVGRLVERLGQAFSRRSSEPN